MADKEHSKNDADQRTVKHARDDIRSRDDLTPIKKSRDDVEPTNRPLTENPLLTAKPAKQNKDGKSDSNKGE